MNSNNLRLVDKFQLNFFPYLPGRHLPGNQTVQPFRQIFGNRWPGIDIGPHHGAIHLLFKNFHNLSVLCVFQRRGDFGRKHLGLFTELFQSSLLYAVSKECQGAFFILPFQNPYVFSPHHGCSRFLSWNGNHPIRNPLFF